MSHEPPFIPVPPTYPSAHYPLPQHPVAMQLRPEDAGKSERWRLVLGCSAAILALLAGYYAYLNIAGVMRAVGSIQGRGGTVAPGSLAVALAIIGAYCLMALGYAAVGTWNIVQRRSTARAPLVTAIVVGSIGLVLTLAEVITSGIAGHPTHIAGIGLSALIIGRAVIVLRIKPVPAWPAAAVEYAADH
ncbi:hypothetical protein [Sinomonas sp. P10A9]|uniref:Uncharacterized protein n=1 Tax=Sinomonas puerhi TaxID=3238584 RepID=A0AB39L362_9MICC